MGVRDERLLPTQKLVGASKQKARRSRQAKRRASRALIHKDFARLNLRVFNAVRRLDGAFLRLELHSVICSMYV